MNHRRCILRVLASLAAALAFAPAVVFAQVRPLTLALAPTLTLTLTPAPILAPTLAPAQESVPAPALKFAPVVAFAQAQAQPQAPAPVPAPAPTQEAAPPPVLKNDPFARPVLSSRGAPAPSSVSAAPRAATATATAPGSSWNPELTAILEAGKDSIVKVGGVVVQIGQVIDGHRLVEVRESEAVFIAVQTKKRVVLSLSGGDPPPGPPLQEEGRAKERRDDSKEGQGK